MLQMFTQMGGGGGGEAGVPFGNADASGEITNSTSIDQTLNQQVNEQAGVLFKQLLPSTKEVAKILRDNNFNVTEDDKVLIDVN